MSNASIPLLIFILFLFLLALYLLGRYRSRRYFLALLFVVLIVLNIVLVNLLAAQTFKRELNCDALIDRPLNMKELSLCKGLTTTPIGPLEFLRPLEIGSTTFLGVKYGPWTISGLKLGPWVIPILPSLAQTIDPLLADFRPFIVWIIILFFALASLFLTVIWNKVTTFIREIQTPEGFKTALTNLSIWLFFFVSFCGLFYSRFVIVP